MEREREIHQKSVRFELGWWHGKERGEAALVELVYTSDLGSGGDSLCRFDSCRQ
jgi:hypothetical protein